MRGQRRGDVDLAVTRGVRNDDAPGQQVQAVLDAAGQLPVLHVEILVVPDDRVMDVGGMSAQLMGAAGHRLHGHPGQFLRRLLHHIVERHRVLGLVLAMTGNAHALLALVTGEIGGDAALLGLRHAGEHRPVDLAGVAVAEGLGQLLRGKAGLGDEDDAGGFPVQPVHEARLVALAVGEGIQHAIEMAAQARTALHGKAGGLVQHHHHAVLEQHHVLDGLAVVIDELGGLRPGVLAVVRLDFDAERRDAHALPGSKARGAFGALAVDAHLTGAQQLLQVAEAKAREMDLEPTVEAHASLIGGHGLEFNSGHMGLVLALARLGAGIRDGQSRHVKPARQGAAVVVLLLSVLGPQGKRFRTPGASQCPKGRSFRLRHCGQWQDRQRPRGWTGAPTGPHRAAPYARPPSPTAAPCPARRRKRW